MEDLWIAWKPTSYLSRIYPWRIFFHVEKFQISVHDRCGEIWDFSTCGVISNFSTWQMWRNLIFLHMTNLYGVLVVFLCCFVTFYAVLWEQTNFLAIYAVLSQNLFCRDWRAFAWRNISMWEMWGKILHVIGWFCDLRCFVAKSVESRFTRFSVEKN